MFLNDLQVIPLAIKGQISKIDSIQDFLMSPSQQLYENLLLQIISQLYQTKIKVFYITEKHSLRCKIYNNDKCKPSKLKILKYGQSYYPLWKKSYTESYSLCQEILGDVVKESIKMEIQPLRFTVNFEQGIQHTPMKKPHHKKSFSDTMKDQNIDFLQSQSWHRSIKKESDDGDFLLLQCNQIIQDNNQYDLLNQQEYIQENMLPSLVKQQSQPVQTQSQRLIVNSDYADQLSLFASLSPQKIKQGLCCGRLKFFDEGKNYGFIIMDSDKSDIFVHYDDLQKIGISKDLLKTAKQGNIIRFSFTCMNYHGKYQGSRKAVDLKLLSTHQFIAPYFSDPYMMDQNYNQNNTQ